jgi:drug/metabolite transporter (DMT)-like permease
MWLLYALLASALWGFEYAIVERILGDRISALSLVAVQMSIGSILLAAAAWGFGTLRSDLVTISNDRGLGLLILASISVFTLGNLMIACSIKEGKAVLAGFIEISYPLFIILFSLLLGWGGNVGPRTVVGGLVILAGVLILKGEH